MFVANRMTKNPITVEPTTPVNEAAKLMKRRNIRRLPVVEKGSLVGGSLTLQNEKNTSQPL